MIQMTHKNKHCCIGVTMQLAAADKNYEIQGPELTV